MANTDNIKGVLNGFDTVMKKREANVRAFENFDRALMKYCTPGWIHGSSYGKQMNVRTQEQVVCRIIETEICWVCNWNGRILTPYWRVEIMRDLSGLTSSMKNLFIEGPNYEIGYKGTTGPWIATTPHYHQVRDRALPAKRDGQSLAPARG